MTPHPKSLSSTGGSPQIDNLGSMLTRLHSVLQQRRETTRVLHKSHRIGIRHLLQRHNLTGHNTLNDIIQFSTSLLTLLRLHAHVNRLDTCLQYSQRNLNAATRTLEQRKVVKTNIVLHGRLTTPPTRARTGLTSILLGTILHIVLNRTLGDLNMRLPLDKRLLNRRKRNSLLGVHIQLHMQRLSSRSTLKLTNGKRNLAHKRRREDTLPISKSHTINSQTPTTSTSSRRRIHKLVGVWLVGERDDLVFRP